MILALRSLHHRAEAAYDRQYMACPHAHTLLSCHHVISIALACRACCRVWALSKQQHKICRRLVEFEPRPERLRHRLDYVTRDHEPRMHAYRLWIESVTPPSLQRNCSAAKQTGWGCDCWKIGRWVTQWRSRYRTRRNRAATTLYLEAGGPALLYHLVKTKYCYYYCRLEENSRYYCPSMRLDS